jgi:uncharacterized OsmC-like protein
MSRIVLVKSGTTRYGQNISIGPNRLIADEPSDLGGNDEGPNPYELLLAALGVCTGSGRHSWRSPTIVPYIARWFRKSTFARD